MPTPRLGYIYLVTNAINGKQYVGQTCIPLERRWKQHVDAAGDGSSFAIHCAIRKHGVANFSIVELARVSREYMDSVEIHCIELFGTFTLTGHGYNMTLGGGGSKGKTQPPVTDEWRRKQREAHLGVKLSESHRESIRRSHIGSVYSKRGPETGKKIADRLRGGHLSEETKRRMSEKRSGRPQGPHSEETKRKIREARKRAWAKWWEKKNEGKVVLLS
jgi:group I intron endonuclease